MHLGGVWLRDKTNVLATNSTTFVVVFVAPKVDTLNESLGVSTLVRGDKFY